MREQITNWAVGVSGGLAAIGFTLSSLEYWVRILGGVGGIVVTAFTIINIVRGWIRESRAK